MNIGQKIQEVLKKQNKTLVELSRISGIRESLLYNIISQDINNISIDTITKISNTLNISPTELLGVETIEEAVGKAFSYGRDLKLLIYERLTDLELTETEMEELLMHLDYIKYKREKLLNM